MSWSPNLVVARDNRPQVPGDCLMRTVASLHAAAISRRRNDLLPLVERATEQLRLSAGRVAASQSAAA